MCSIFHTVLQRERNEMKKLIFLALLACLSLHGDDKDQKSNRSCCWKQIMALMTAISDGIPNAKRLLIDLAAFGAASEPFDKDKRKAE